MMGGNIHAVLSDLDDTLIDHDSAACAGVKELHAAYGAPYGLDSDVVMVRWREIADRHYERYLAGEIGFHEQRMERIRSFFDAQFSDEEAATRFSLYLEAYERNWRLFPDAIPCLESLRGLRLGIISNGDGAQQNSKVLRLGLAPRLGTVIVSGDVGMRKPSQPSGR
jgi:putative hydrolase of the HAD superfamily